MRELLTAGCIVMAADVPQRVQGIRQQIETTLMGISGITSVILSVEGQTEGVLQP